MGDELVYVNGELLPAAEARIAVFDQAFLYGYGLFETMRSYNGNIFMLDEHMARLRHGAAAIGLERKLHDIDLAEACRETVRANGNGDLRVRITVTGGDAPSFPWEEDTRPATVVIITRHFPGFPPERYEKGYRVCIASVRRCAASAVAGIKSVNYLITTLARREAAAYGLDECILLDDRGFIAEGGNTNVFFVRGGTLVTPTLGSGILPGITRQLVMDLAAILGIPVTEAELRPEDLGTFDEAFMTSSVIEIMPVTAVRNESGTMIDIGSGRPGDVTKRLLDAYRARI